MKYILLIQSNYLYVGTILLIGVICKFIANAYDNYQSNELEISLCAFSKLASFVCILISASIIIFGIRNYSIQEINNYEIQLAHDTYDTLGGEDTLRKVNKTIEETGLSEILVSTDITDIRSIKETSERMSAYAFELSEDELALMR